MRIISQRLFLRCSILLGWRQQCHPKCRPAYSKCSCKPLVCGKMRICVRCTSIMSVSSFLRVAQLILFSARFLDERSFCFSLQLSWFAFQCKHLYVIHEHFKHKCLLRVLHCYSWVHFTVALECPEGKSTIIFLLISDVSSIHL